MKLSNVPDSSPGPTTARARSGKVVFEPSSLASAAASVHFAKPVDSGPISAYRSAKLRQVTAVSDGLVMTVMPSYAIFSSMNSMPAASHSAFSSSLIVREASLMSVSPAQKRLNPSPVPGPSTV